MSPQGYLVEGPDAPPGDPPPPAPGWARVRLYVTDPQREAARALLEAAVAAWPEATVTAEPLDPEWRERWKQWFHGFDVTPRLSVRPPWEDPRGTELEVVIEPGMAFGTGQHETTRLCLEDLVERCADDVPPAVLDVGCGTGILALAAVLLGVPEVVGVDVDPDAIRCAVENAERNAVVDRVVLSTTPIERVDGRYPLVVANILAHILTAIAVPLAARVAPGGQLVLCGIGRDQAGGVRAHFEAADPGLRWVAEASHEAWVRMTFERPA